jgi:hypothetical protein
LDLLVGHRLLTPRFKRTTPWSSIAAFAGVTFGVETAIQLASTML